MTGKAIILMGRYNGNFNDIGVCLHSIWCAGRKQTVICVFVSFAKLQYNSERGKFKKCSVSLLEI
jgi:hypothetical protein